MEPITKTIDIERSLRTLYNQCPQFEAVDPGHTRVTLTLQPRRPEDISLCLSVTNTGRSRREDNKPIACVWDWHQGTDSGSALSRSPQRIWA